MSTPTLRLVRTADKPGPGPMPDAILRALDITIGRRMNGMLSGDYRSKALGLGTELAQVREYQPGDDVRQIDWNVTARTTVPHVRVQVADRVLTTWLMLDTSPSMGFGTADRRKYDVAEGVAVAVGQVATRHGNALGLLSFGDEHARMIPPGQGRKGMLGLLTLLREEPPAEGGGATSLGSAIQSLNRMARRSRLVVIVSDFRGPRDWSSALVELAGRHSVIAVEIQDPREQEIPDVGELWLVDPETGRQLRVDTRSKKLRERFANAAVQDRAEVAGMLARAGAQHVVLSTRGDWLRTLAGFLNAKGTAR
ncbi:MAG: DUF58 domain-containing protein [Dehalococcoidia bacterium]|uniref:DUF58 domain-containing protein n=1 Tax=Candidatus Amarobacter glycogenicus TaxID=3140699 RepID=UPI001DB4235E|nr:DUF58 domain-containing protein [Dehalococcoidia bacterium]MBK7724743.1 DUF58 domain-containing protein [Dehalococcoidia bacterium]MBK8560490.1 DUF58 domain-containing protein [Dehalococcoidia bacterium]